MRVRDVKLPGYLETFPVVIGRADNSLVLAQNVEWAERRHLHPPVGQPLPPRDAQRQPGALVQQAALSHRLGDRHPQPPGQVVITGTPRRQRPRRRHAELTRPGGEGAVRLTEEYSKSDPLRRKHFVLQRVHAGRRLVYATDERD